MAAVNSSRNKSRDAAIKQQISAIQSQAALLFSDTGNFDTLCTAGTKTRELFEGAFNASAKVNSESMCLSSGTAGVYSSNGALATLSKVTTPDAWAVVVRLRNGNYFCLDSTGLKREQGGGRPIDNSPLNVDCL